MILLYLKFKVALNLTQKSHNDINHTANQTDILAAINTALKVRMGYRKF